MLVLELLTVKEKFASSGLMRYGCVPSTVCYSVCCWIFFSQ